MARTEDVAVNVVVAGRAQVLDEGWMRRMNVPRRDTREVAGTLPAGAWDDILGRPDTARAAAVGAFGPNDDWSDDVGHRPWQGHARGTSSARPPSATTPGTSARR